MTRTLTRTARGSTAVAAIVAALMAVVALAGPASATSTGHFDLAAEVDCTARTVELLVENHDTGATFNIDTFLFEVTSGNTVPAITNDTNRFGSGPVRVLTEDENQVANGKLLIGLEAEYANCISGNPAVTFRVTGTPTVPTGGRAAAYLNDSTTTTQLDTASGSGRNVGAKITGHSDRRWGFETTGDYVLPITAAVNFGGAVRRDTGDMQIDVS